MGGHMVIVGASGWKLHASGNKLPECLPDACRNSHQSNEKGNKLGVACCNGALSNSRRRERGRGNRPGCQEEKTYEQAVSHCESLNLRLCTQTEIEDGAAMGSGCSFNAN